jgi:hypothetical protein
MAEAGKPVRSWKVIADELSKETNSERVLALAEELGLALVQEQQALKKQKQEDNTSSVPRPEGNKQRHNEV